MCPCGNSSSRRPTQQEFFRTYSPVLAYSECEVSIPLNCTTRSNCSGVRGVTERRDCLTRGRFLRIVSDLIVSRLTGWFRGLMGVRSTYDQSPSVAVGSGEACL